METQKKFTIILVMIITLMPITSCNQQGKATFSITSSSPKAIALYHQAMEKYQFMYRSEALELIDQALAEDPDFFFGLYFKAMNAFFREEEQFKVLAEKALNSQAKLSKGEQLMKEALQKLYKNPEADIRPYGQQLVQLFPEDIKAYNQLAMCQFMADDREALLKTRLNQIEIADNPAPYYNGLGYFHMRRGKMDEAEKAFNKYIELAPDQANPYDSKGDYFMRVKNYQKAYESYSKALEKDSTFSASLRKVKLAKNKLDSFKNNNP